MRNGWRFAAVSFVTSAVWIGAQAQARSVPGGQGVLKASLPRPGADGDKSSRDDKSRDDKKEHTHVGELAPADLKINGKVTVGSLHGKPVLLHIWATWCGPCMASMRTFHRLVDQYAKTDLQVILLDRDDDYVKAHQYLAQQGMSWPDYHDSGRFFKAFGGHGIPATVVIDRDGVVRYHHTGEGLSEKSVGKLEKALARSIMRPVTPAGQATVPATDDDPDKP